jgi:hypothetical protein
MMKAPRRILQLAAAAVRDAIYKVALKPQAAGPVDIWDGDLRRTSIEHDSVHDESQCGDCRSAPKRPV